MKRLAAWTVLPILALLAWPLLGVGATETAGAPIGSVAGSLTLGQASPQSISVLAFAPDGTLFLGDGKGGAVFAIDTSSERPAPAEPIELHDVEAKIAARLGTRAADVMVHDLAVHPISHRVFLAVSHGRASWNLAWALPNHIANADLLLVVDAKGTIEEFPLGNVRFARVELPNPISADKTHPFLEGVSLRTDTITDLAVTADTLFVAGLSNEEFASTLWRVPLPFAGGASATTLEIYHGAHGEYETHAPIRTFVPYVLDGEEYILAAYLCTPLSLFKVADLKDKAHLRGRTIAELGSGNYPLDMVVVKGEQSDRLFLANSGLPLVVVDTRDIAAFEGAITERPSSYTAGVSHIARSPSNIQQLDALGDRYLLTLQRAASGTLDLGVIPLRRG
ncbi:MAG TPA: hypothetical protein VNB06_03260 [Thermoanaerobaculia bacterium]|nr:hypothetical protein [Thermoanaerobaculia bacterium]